MKTVKIYDVDVPSGLSITIPMGLLGARGIVLASQNLGAGQTTIIGKNAAATNTCTLINMFHQVGGHSNDFMCGFPCLWDNIVISTDNNNDRHLRALLTDEPFAPWGRVPIASGSVSPGAGVTSAIGNFGASFGQLVQFVRGVFNGTGKFHITYHLTLDGSDAGAIVATNAVSANTTLDTGFFPVNGNQHFDCTNDDAGGITIFGEVWGYLSTV